MVNDLSWKMSSSKVSRQLRLRCEFWGPQHIEGFFAEERKHELEVRGSLKRKSGRLKKRRESDKKRGKCKKKKFAA